MKYCVIFSLLFLSCTAYAADKYLSDVPEGHWAHDAVYELVQKGITGGFPDGTFKGNRPITRAEMASFLSRLAKSARVQEGKYEKLIEEIKAEIALTLHKQYKAEQENRVAGNLDSWFKGMTQGNRGGKAGYRLKMSLQKNFDLDSKLQVNLDTMDAGYNTSVTRDFSTKLIDVQSNFNWLNLAWQWNMGPGTVVHHEPSGLFPAENNTVFFRPKSGIAAKTDLGRFRLVGAYVARDQADTGQIGVNELTAQLVGDFDPIRISLQPRYLISHNAKRDALAELGLDLVPNEHITSSLLLSAGDFSAGTSGLYVKALASINNLAHLGNYLTLRFDKVGSKYRIKELDKYEFVFLNNFERYILDGTADLGVSFKQELFNGFSLEWMSDYVTDGSFNYGENYPETYYLWQASLAKLFFPAVRMNLFYRAYNVPSGIAQFADAVPTVSNVIGLGAFCAF